jgi:hypothetical protein
LEHPHAELSAYIDGALDPAALAAVEGHLGACAVCRAHVAQLRATIAFVQALPDPLPSRRLVPRLAAPAWLAPLRTLMTLASGAAVFLFIASALVGNITLLAGSGAPAAAQPASRDTAAKVVAPSDAQRASESSAAPAPAASPNAAFAVAGPTASTAQLGYATPAASRIPDAAKGSVDAATPDAKLRADESRPSVAPGAAAELQSAARSGLQPERSPLLSPWLWLVLAIACGAIAIALHRRLRASV